MLCKYRRDSKTDLYNLNLCGVLNISVESVENVLWLCFICVTDFWEFICSRKFKSAIRNTSQFVRKCKNHCDSGLGLTFLF